MFRKISDVVVFRKIISQAVLRKFLGGVLGWGNEDQLMHAAMIHVCCQSELDVVIFVENRVCKV